MFGLVLYAAAFVSGSAVLALEILGGRMLAPIYGTGLIVRSTLWAVTLLSLGLGLKAAGKSSTRSPQAQPSGLLLAGAGAWLLAVPWLRRPVLILPDPLGWGAIPLASILLLALPFFLLGAAYPGFLRARAAGLSRAGRSSGWILGLSALGGALAFLATGSRLIPCLGVSQLAARLGGLLLLAAAAVRLTGGPRGLRQVLLPLLVVVTGLVGLGGWFPAPGPPPPTETARLLVLRDSPRAEVRVLEAYDRRYLLVDGAVRAMTEATTFETMMPSVAAMQIPRYLFARPDTLLLLGLGGGSLAQEFARAGWRVKAVEIDPVVADMARSCFGLAPEEAEIVLADPWSHLLGHDRRYPLILLDALDSPAAFHHLAGRKALALLTSRLTPDGILVINLPALGWNDPLVTLLGRALRRDFHEILALPTSEPPNVLGDIVLLAANRPLEIPEDCLGNPIEFLADPPAHWAVVQRNHAWDNRFVPDAKPEGPRVYDDPVARAGERYLRAPRAENALALELLAGRVEREARRRCRSDANLGRFCR